MKKVRCIEQFSTKGRTFRAGETYYGNPVNDNWCVVDSVGMDTDEYQLHFEDIEEVNDEREFTEKDACSPAIEKRIRWSEPDILLDWLGEGNKESNDVKKTLWSRIRQWYNDWEIIQWYENGL